jgi:hypothetical protein
MGIEKPINLYDNQGRVNDSEIAEEMAVTENHYRKVDRILGKATPESLAEDRGKHLQGIRIKKYQEDLIDSAVAKTIDSLSEDEKNLIKNKKNDIYMNDIWSKDEKYKDSLIDSAVAKTIDSLSEDEKNLIKNKKNDFLFNLLKSLEKK